jgi:hypothetical protein
MCDLRRAGHKQYQGAGHRCEARRLPTPHNYPLWYIL